ncbi:hypothetical protein P3T76_008432 [Phytophthora citrophthora]|uniref:RxLR effector protein n=1 Tax=Phytophthora citrophthora TaxID=4793 RepID=A0AAD9GKI5_9STRA|nr:hypothetical protein P3T76_008428 [Phytophthora citrophthora]KAK1940106.1 hypothetical protein P3T76_008429 [Phytophthora citrophthora]KAK1940107.1 hypothetical protein P3T76_008430 [Phytophthora citrophthora]KAK1940108.1 hypothetical protein P3T76_008431 [Phytophthora citrophthora]KAK1940109.1 hypothetical protein P3T76_008432 [Phytophthora citrophthora]
MRVNCFLLVAVAALVGFIDAFVAATDNTVAKLGMVNPAFAVKSNSHRSLRLRNDDVPDNEDDVSDDVNEQDESDDDSVQEERGFLDQIALLNLGRQFFGKSSDEIGQLINNLTDSQIILLFDKGGDILTKHLPGFRTGMNGADFGNLIKDLHMDQQALLLSAYSKYLHFKGLLKV